LWVVVVLEGEDEEAERREVGEGDGEAADAWDGAGVKLAGLVRAIDATQAEWIVDRGSWIVGCGVWAATLPGVREPVVAGG
jgi:hypothetical protein